MIKDNEQKRQALKEKKERRERLMVQQGEDIERVNTCLIACGRDKDDFEELFGLYDLDESGHVDIFEFKDGIARTGLMDIELCDTVFETMDINQDGQVGIREFLLFFASM